MIEFKSEQEYADYRDQLEAENAKLKEENAKLRDYLAEHQSADNLYDIAVKQFEIERDYYKAALETILRVYEEDCVLHVTSIEKIAKQALEEKE